MVGRDNSGRPSPERGSEASCRSPLALKTKLEQKVFLLRLDPAEARFGELGRGFLRLAVGPIRRRVGTGLGRGRTASSACREDSAQ